MPQTYTVSQYLQQLRAIRQTGSATDETSFYPPVEHLFNAVGQQLDPPILFSTQLRNQGAGMPDGGFFPQRKSSRRSTQPPQLLNPERGAVEIKPATIHLDDLQRSVQTAKYLQQYGAVLLTNLRQFRLLHLDQQGNVREAEPTYTLAASADDLWNRPLADFIRHADLLPDFLARVMLFRAPLVQPKDVAWLLASYAREARARAEDHPLSSFAAVKTALQESLGIRFEGDKGEHFFRSTLVQTLFYGIFSAWILWRRTARIGDRFLWQTSADYLRVPVIQQLFYLVASPAGLNATQLREVLDLAGDALNRVQPAFFEAFRQEDAVAYFYEPFLQAFDPQLRKDLGVWYTPREIVHYMVERVDHLLRTQLDIPLGLASPQVCILDPCCGTGAYLTAVQSRIHRTLLAEAGDDNALVPDALRRAMLTRVFGFEIMPAPFVIAHLQLAAQLEDAGAPLTGTDRARVYLTNALTGWVPEAHPQTELFEAFKHEREAADGVKQSAAILVILGNPPYNGYAGIASVPEERGLTDAYRTPASGLPAPQGHGLNDLYIRFFRIAERRIVANSPSRGIVCYISNNAWLDGLSHTSMRARYLQSFQHLYIDNLNGDKYRTGKRTPEGKPDPSAFSTPQNREGIQVGTAIATLVRTSTQPGTTIDLRNLWGTTKLSHLERESRRETEPTYDSLTLEPAIGLPFAKRTFERSYLEWPRFPELFAASFPGIKTSRDYFVVDIDRASLDRRMSLYFDKAVSNEALSGISTTITSDAYCYSASTIRLHLQRKGFKSWQVIRYIYRPFDVRWLYWEPDSELLRRPVPEFLKAFFPKSPALTIPQQNRRSYDSPTVGRSITDLNLVDGGANTFPAHVVRSSVTDVEIVHENTTLAAAAFLTAINAGSADLMLYSLSILHAPRYAFENVGLLEATGPASHSPQPPTSSPTPPPWVAASPNSSTPNPP